MNSTAPKHPQIQTLHQKIEHEAAPEWTPTMGNVAALPEPIRRYVRELETTRAAVLAALKDCFNASREPHGPSCPFCRLEISDPKLIEGHSVICPVGAAFAQAEGR